MPRIGMNPGRGKKSAYQPARVTVAVLTYIPNQVGYFQDRLEVTRACIRSILANTTAPYDLMDNGSCQKRWTCCGKCAWPARLISDAICPKYRQDRRVKS